MAGERRNQDYKLHFDPADKKAEVKLVKNIVSMANSGGGTIIFGRDELHEPGISAETARSLDSARISQKVERFVETGLIHLQHDIRTLSNGQVLVMIIIEPAERPVVMKRDGTWSGSAAEVLFRKGDVFIRHSTRSEKISQADMNAFIQNAHSKGINEITRAANIIKNAGPDSKILYHTDTIGSIRKAEDLLKLKMSMKKMNLSYILDSDQLLWIFIQRHGLELEKSDLEILVESALRRSSTLFWWLRFELVDEELIQPILFRIPEMRDRDKSDVARTAIEIGSLYLKVETMKILVKKLLESQYKHIREQAERFEFGASPRETIISRINKRKDSDSTLYINKSQSELEEIADGLANTLLKDGERGNNKGLADINRILWAKDRDWL